jgi:hypothetical protein
MFSARQSKNKIRRLRLSSHYTRTFGYDTVRFNWDLGSDPTVFPMPSDYEWFGNNPLPLPKEVEPCQLSMQLKCVAVDIEARGGGHLNLKSSERGFWRKQDGVFFKLVRSQWGTVLAIEASLPKLLYGHNKNPLRPDMLPSAFDELTRRARGFIPSLPDVSELEAWRIDATSDVQLRSELEVGLVARVLADRVLNNALPARYPTGGSLKWSYPKTVNHSTVRCYGKSAESGDESISGRYRNELQCMGGKQWRQQLADMVARGQLDPKWLSGRGRTCVKAECLITEPALCTGLLEALTGLCDGAIDFVRGVGSMTAMQAIDLLQEKSGVTRSRAVQLVGYSHIVRVLGWGFTGLGRKGVWLAQNEFKTAGVDPAFIEFSSAEKIGAGAGMVAGGALAGGLAVAGAIAGNALVDALVPDKPGPVSFVEPGPVPAGELAADKAA